MSDQGLPKIFVYIVSDEPGFESAIALAEDGVMITSHISSSIKWSECDMGLRPDYPASSKHEAYQLYYPQGYALVNLLSATEDQLRSNESFMRALDLHTKGMSDDPS